MRKLFSTSLAAVLPLFLLAAVQPADAQQSTTHLGGKPSAMVTLVAWNLFPGATMPLYLVKTDGRVDEAGPPFSLPEKTSLVITDMLVSVNGPPAAGVTRGGLRGLDPEGTLDSVHHPYWSFDATQQASQHINLTGGARYAVVPKVQNSGDSANAVFFIVYGYLTSD